jgi:hypothetical protein
VTIGEHLRQFDGRPVADWKPGQPLPDLAASAVRIADEEHWEKAADDTVVSQLVALAAEAGSLVESIVIGPWSGAYEAGPQSIVAYLAAAAPTFTRLRSVFVGDLTYEECEISWINQADFAPLLGAYPGLECLGSRGSVGLRLGPVRHERLRSLVVESGGLPTAVVQGIIDSDLPALTRLELWLGDQSYGNDITPADLSPLFARRPNLRYLGLRNADNADALAVAVAEAEVLEDLHVLDLSLGALSDEGGEALATSRRILGLQRLDLHHHYLSEAMMDRLVALPIEVDVSDRKQAEDHRGETYRSVFASE